MSVMKQYNSPSIELLGDLQALTSGSDVKSCWKCDEDPRDPTVVIGGGTDDGGFLGTLGGR